MSKANNNGFNGFPSPKKVKCFKDCGAEILVKFVIPRLAWSKKNDWGYLTEKEENQAKYICDQCLTNLYRQDKLHYLDLVKNPKKRQVIRTYIHDGIITSSA